jgi:FixJ family two-component response regulator
MVYVVDDDFSVRTALRRLLLSLGHPVRLFASAEQFLASTDSGARGCLILDLMLPGMSGLELQAQLADDGWKLPVIFITAHDDAASRDAALCANAVAYLSKPFGRDEVLSHVRHAMGST